MYPSHKYKTKEKFFLALFVLIYLASLGFYNPFGILQKGIIKFSLYFFIAIGLLYAIFEKRSLKNRHIPIITYISILMGILVAAFMGSIFHEQSLSVSLIAILPFFLGYLCFFILLKLNIHSETIIKTIGVFVGISMFVYIVNFMTFPNIVFGGAKEEYDMSRGIIRLGVRSIEFVVLLFLYSINKYKLSGGKKWIFMIVLTGFFIVLSLTRQIIVYSFVLGGLMLLRKNTLVKKVLLIMVLYIVSSFLISNISVFKTMTELSQSQIEENRYEEENIRIQAMRYYIFENQTNELTPFLGNGVPSVGNSQWGNDFGKKTEVNRCFTGDVGWAGFYWYFGFFTTMSLLSLLLKAAIKKKKENEKYISYWIWFIILSSVTSAPILYSFQIISISTVLYLVYGQKTDDSTHYSKLQ